TRSAACTRKRPRLRLRPPPEGDGRRRRRPALHDMNDTGRPTPAPQKLILLGRVMGAFGVRGDVKLESWTAPRSQIFRYQPWILRSADGSQREMTGARGRDTGKLVVATLPGCEDRDTAEAMRGTEIWVPREVLP